MPDKTWSVITASGSYIPDVVIKNKDFIDHKFYDAEGTPFEKNPEDTIEKFRQITDIEERRYVSNDLVASDIGYFAAAEALESSGIDKESLDYIIVAHNFGDIQSDNKRIDLVPSLASRIKHKLGIVNPYTIAYDLPFGCPGWLQGMIHANYFIKAGDIKRAMIIGTETLSRVCDPHDRDSMIYSDGAGAVILEAVEGGNKRGVLSHKTRTDTIDHAYMLWMDKSYGPDFNGNDLFLKMNGRKLYEYALKTVPPLIKDTLDMAGLTGDDVVKILIHQANAKMDEAMLKRLFALYGKKEVPDNIMPMTINFLGNNSVATLPILYDLLRKGKMGIQQCGRGDHIVFASVGAGMNVNAMVYQIS
jgi:3-oxoacyl-[acyl-carrier-protein] synthase-3